MFRRLPWIVVCLSHCKSNALKVPQVPLRCLSSSTIAPFPSSAHMNPESVGPSDIATTTTDDNFPDLQSFMADQSWRSLLEVSNTRSRKIRGSNYVQLATVDPETREPRCRCVVFRGFQSLPLDHALSVQLDGLSGVMRMITDARSNKVREIQESSKNKNAELVWWFPKTNEQYRIRGTLVFVGNGPFLYDTDETLALARKQQWGNLTDAARESFFKTPVPGELYEPENEVPPGGRDDSGSVMPPPDNFLLMLLLPRYVDYLRLGNMYRQIDQRHDNNMTWSKHRVNP
jgi:pyridoxamine 5'-phosphate oxidase